MGAGAPGARVFLCRDCLAETPATARGGALGRCESCGSPRLVSRPADETLTIAHVDCDAFYASVEKRDRPELRDKPLIVGGGGRRGVVSTACYIARTFGARSAMPMAQALKLCPDAVVLPPDMAKYSAVARRIRAMMEALTPLVEPLSIDEAFLDLTGCEATHGASAAAILARLSLAIEREIGVSISVGLSYCKFLAKIASELDKPRGFSIIGRAEAKAMLAPMPVARIWGVGKVAEARLAKSGLAIIADIQARDEATMMAEHGGDGRRLWRLANGIDERKVSALRETKSISSETTFDDDDDDKERLVRALLAQCERVAERLRRQNLACGALTLKLRTADFRLRTRSRSGFAPTQLAARLFRVARPLLEKEFGPRFRLIGVAAANFAPAEEADLGDLADGDARRETARERAIESVRERFGSRAIVRGLAFPPRGDHR